MSAPVVGNHQQAAFVYRHLVLFEETNIMGNVYFARHLSWQGRCREMFMRERVPELLGVLGRDLRLVTLKVTCEYYQELNAFDEVIIEMRLAYQRQHRLGLNFDYHLETGLVARGTQEIACMQCRDGQLVPVQPPAPMLLALKPYGPPTASQGCKRSL